MAIAGDDPRKKRIGFCKLLGENMEHYAQKYEINIGRKSKATDLDVVIGDTNISRQHACIAYNFGTGAWELKVSGKNGVTVKDILYTPNSPPVTLQSGDLLQLGDKAFFFLLGKGTRASQKDLKKLKSAGISKARQRAPTLKIVISGDKPDPKPKAPPKPKPAAVNPTQAAPQQPIPGASSQPQQPQPQHPAVAAANAEAVQAKPASPKAANQHAPAPALPRPTPAPAALAQPGSGDVLQSQSILARPQPVQSASASRQAQGLPDQRQAPAVSQLLPGSHEAVQVGLQRPGPQIGFPGHTLQSLALQSSLAHVAGQRGIASQPVSTVPAYNLGPQARPPAGGAGAAGLTAAALQQFDLQAYLKAQQQQQQVQQALQRAGIQPGYSAPFQMGRSAPTVPSVLQQLMTANNAVTAEHGNPRQIPNPLMQQFAPQQADYQQSSGPMYSMPQQLTQRPNFPASSSIGIGPALSNPLQSASSGMSNRSASNQLYPQGFPNQLLQGLEQHQYLQQLQWNLNESQKDQAAGERSSAHK